MPRLDRQRLGCEGADVKSGAAHCGRLDDYAADRRGVEKIGHRRLSDAARCGKLDGYAADEKTEKRVSDEQRMAFDAARGQLDDSAAVQLCASFVQRQSSDAPQCGQLDGSMTVEQLSCF